MAILVNESGMEFAKEMIRSGNINMDSSWSFDANDGNLLLGDDENWEYYGQHHLAVDTDENMDTKAYWKFPIAKDGVIYRSGVIAAKQRAGQMGYQNILDAADELLSEIDEDGRSLKQIFDAIKNLVFRKKQVDLKLPQYMLDNLQKGLELVEAGKAGDGLLDKTVNEAKQMLRTGEIWTDKVVRASAWLARHASDKVAGWDKEGEETPGYVAHLLWLSDGDDNAKAWLEMKKEQLINEGEIKEVGSSFKVFKQADGQYRWFGWVTNKWIDREDEILTDSAHVEFYNYLEANPEDAPELWVWHTKGTARTSKADWWDYANGFFMYSGLLTEDEAKRYTSTSEELGMSHGFRVLGRIGKYITKYRTFEVSELPHEVAANPYTNFIIEEEETKMFTARKRDFLVQRLGEEKVAQLENVTDDAEKELINADVDWKGLNEQYEAEIEEMLAKQVAEQVAETTKSNVSDIVDEVVKELNVEGLQAVLVDLANHIKENAKLTETVNELAEKVNHLMQTEDARIAKALTPRMPIDWANPSANKENIVQEEELDQDVQNQVKNMNGELEWLKGFGGFK